MITLVIPTQNRPQYLERAMAFYKQSASAFPVIVCDSSDADRTPAVAAIVRGCGLNVSLLTFDHGVSINHKLRRGVDAVRSRYVVFAGDDDFLVPTTVDRCVAFLDAHEDFAVAHGRAFAFTVQDAAVRGRMTGVRPYRQVASVLPTPRQRLRAHFGDWTTSFYSVQRTDNVRQIVHTFGKLADDLSACEVYFYAANAIRGKAVKLDANYMYRQVEVSKEYSVNETHVWASAPGWERVRDALVREIALELCHAGHEPFEESAQLVRSLLDRWIEGRRPYEIRRWRCYPPRYYWERALNLGHKLGFRMREFRRPSADGIVVKSIVEARA
jgi:glycosyltransferase domain-containing protein